MLSHSAISSANPKILTEFWVLFLFGTDRYLLADELLRMIKLLGVKTISEQGISEDALDRLAEDTLHEPVLNFNPRQGVTKEDILDILKKAF